MASKNEDTSVILEYINITPEELCISANLDILVNYSDDSHVETMEIISQNREERADDVQITEIVSQNIEKRADDVQTTEIIHQNLEERVGDNQTMEIIPQNLEEIKRGTKTRKRAVSKYHWKQNERKRMYQAGEEHVNSRKKTVPKRQIKTLKDCTKACKFKCSTKITQQERKLLFDNYYKMSQMSKYHFIAATTERFLKMRPKKDESRRTYSFRYFFSINNTKKQVCKIFYLSTLNISQKPVYNVHAKKDKSTGVVQEDLRGKSKNKHAVSESMKQTVREHIESFPAIESHYCRARTSTKYLESKLTITKMYNLYKEKCTAENEAYVKESMYRFIFCNEFNIAFHKPKSDRCPVCEKFEVAKREGIDINEADVEQHRRHITEKEKMREERQADRQGRIPVLCFDLENVLTCPKAEISPLFYYKKLNVYNLTAHLSTTKKVYCALWTEYISGRSGNDIASAFIRILEKVVEDNEITELITWSDSCVPQNRNSVITYAVLQFMKAHPNIKSITMKYSIPGHSAIQEVDNAHSVIERALNKTEYFSPLGIIRVLKSVNPKNPYGIIQLNAKDFKDFQDCAKKLNFKLVPFASLSTLVATSNSFEIEYKQSYEAKEFVKVNIKPRQSIGLQDTVPILQHAASKKQDKREHFIKMIPFMGIQDREYYKSVFEIKDNELEASSNHPSGSSGSGLQAKNKSIKGTKGNKGKNAKNKEGRKKK